MEATVSQLPLNPVQLHLLKVFSYVKHEEDLKELELVLLDFYQKKLDEETGRLWEEGKLNENVIEEMLNCHQRTPYK